MFVGSPPPMVLLFYTNRSLRWKGFLHVIARLSIAQFYLSLDLSSKNFLVYFYCQTHRRKQLPLVPLCSSFCTNLGMREWGRAQEMMSRVQGHSNNLRKCFFHSRVHAPGDAFLNPFPVQRTWIKAEKTTPAATNCSARSTGRCFKWGLGLLCHSQRFLSMARDWCPQPGIDAHGQGLMPMARKWWSWTDTDVHR